MYSYHYSTTGSSHDLGTGLLSTGLGEDMSDDSEFDEYEVVYEDLEVPEEHMMMPSMNDGSNQQQQLDQGQQQPQQQNDEADQDNDDDMFYSDYEQEEINYSGPSV